MEIEKMNTDKLKQYIFDEFPTVFETSFACEMLDNILSESEEIKDINYQVIYLTEMIPQIKEHEIRLFIK